MQKQVNYIAECCFRMGIRKAVICPGSRNAPLILAFSRHPGIQSFSVADERSAAFIALGMASASREPVVLICTSGTAALNFYPAIAEAYYREIPLLVLTADRPPELIDQWDGQAIHQEDIFDKHIRGSFQAPDDLSEESSAEELAELTIHAIQLASGQIPGPVHINLPFREPLYPKDGAEFSYPTLPIPPAQQSDIKTDPPSEFDKVFERSERIMLLAGAGLPDAAQNELLKKLRDKAKLVVLGDIASGSMNAGLSNWDLLIGSVSNTDADALAPDLLISIGTATISKKLKEMLRRNKPAAHWHITPSGIAADPFFSFPRIFHCDRLHFLHHLIRQCEHKTAGPYVQQWKDLEQKLHRKLNRWQGPYSEIHAVYQILKSLPAPSVLHLANSMPVRYASMLGIPQNVEVYCNRGTSGIDGCSSTAVGAALSNTAQNFLLTGDIAFFYDINAFWHSHLPANLKIVLLNNKGGGIFRLIEGPASQPELEERFETRHFRTAENVCKDFGIAYFSVSDMNELNNVPAKFYSQMGPALLEVHTDPVINSETYKAFRDAVKLDAG